MLTSWFGPTQQEVSPSVWPQLEKEFNATKTAKKEEEEKLMSRLRSSVAPHSPASVAPHSPAEVVTEKKSKNLVLIKPNKLTQLSRHSSIQASFHNLCLLYVEALSELKNSKQNIKSICKNNCSSQNKSSETVDQLKNEYDLLKLKWKELKLENEKLIAEHNNLRKILERKTLLNYVYP